MQNNLHFEIHRATFDTGFVPCLESRLSTNLTNLCKNRETREANIELFYKLVNLRLNEILCSQNQDGNRYKIGLNVLTILTVFRNSNRNTFPISEILESNLSDKLSNKTIKGPIGFNLSSYIRDFDFYRILPLIKSGNATKEQSESFGDLHGLLFQMMFKKNYEFGVLDSFPITAISISTNRTYTRVNNVHPILGQEYIENGQESDTALYFQKMGLEVKYFMPQGSSAPLAFYHARGDLESRSDQQLAMLIAVMETQQKIYRPEIYSSNISAGDSYQPDLSNLGFVRLPINYNRQERDSVLSVQQADYVEREFLMPNNDNLKKLILNSKK
jgi:Domain of unknown function (DUF1852)